MSGHHGKDEIGIETISDKKILTLSQDPNFHSVPHISPSELLTQISEHERA